MTNTTDAKLAQALADADHNARRAQLQTVREMVAEAASRLQHTLATWDDDACEGAEADEMRTRADDDILGALMDVDDTFRRVLDAYPARGGK